MSSTSPVPSASTAATGNAQLAMPTKPHAGKVTGWQKLPQRMGADTAAASIATLMISPVICLIDRSIMENASGRSKSVLHSLSTSARTLLLRPHTFFFSKPFALIYMTYFGTYFTANVLDTLTSASSTKPLPINHVTTGYSKFVATSVANMGLGLVKDRQFARMFGSGSPRAVPPPIMVLFATRDAMTVAFSFNVPPILAGVLPDTKWMSAASIAQFSAPAACQLLSTPLHLMGLDMYNREGKGWWDRARQVRRNYWQSAAARMCRIVPAFGFGGVTNAKLRRGFMEKVEAMA